MKEGKKLTVYQLTLIGVMTAITCIMGPLSLTLPISPVPISLTNLAIYISVFVLGWKRGTVSYGVYLLIGFVGLPVFSGFTSGPGKLAGPTGGYLVGFLFMAVLSGWFIERYWGKFWMYIIGMGLGTLVAYGFGTVWLSVLLKNSFTEALAIGVLPFLLGDVLKIAAAAIVGPILRTQLIRAGLK